MGISQLASRKPLGKMLLKKITAIVNHVAICLKPRAIYVVGSMARGECHAHSDLDLVVVVDQISFRQEMALAVHPSRPHKDVPLDLHLIDAAQFREFKEIGGLSFEAYRNGKLVYDGASR